MSKNINRYYVYALLDPSKPGEYIYDEFKFYYEPFYIGKGCGNRYKAHSQKNVYEQSTNSFKNSKIKKIIRDGDSVISIKVIENLSEEESYINEILLIEKIGRRDLNKGTLCNLTDGGEGGLGYIREWGKVGIRKINMYDESIYTDYDSLIEACEENNIKSKGNIIGCCQGKYLHYKGYIWQYADVEKKNLYIENRNKQLNKNKIKQYLNNGEVIIFNSIKEAAQSNNVTDTCVIYSCQGKTGKYSKYNFEYIDEYKKSKYLSKRLERSEPNLKEIPVIQLSIYGEYIKEWSSSARAGDIGGYNSSLISSCCRGVRKTHAGYRWLLKNDYEVIIYK